MTAASKGGASNGGGELLHPPKNKALIRDYQPPSSPQYDLIKALFSGGGGVASLDYDDVI